DGLLLVRGPRAEATGPLAGVQCLPLAVGGRLELGDALRRDLPIELVEVAVVATLEWPQAVRVLVGPALRLVRVDDLLRGVLPKSLEAECGQHRITVGHADEQAQRAALQRLVAQMLHQGRRDLV